MNGDECLHTFPQGLITAAGLGDERRTRLWRRLPPVGLPGHQVDRDRARVDRSDKPIPFGGRHRCQA